jgi:hypothetical protein
MTQFIRAAMLSALVYSLSPMAHSGQNTGTVTTVNINRVFDARPIVARPNRRQHGQKPVAGFMGLPSHKKRKAVLGDGPSTVLPKRGSLDELGPQTGDPAQTNRRARHVTMRHWITSFRC